MPHYITPFVSRLKITDKQLRTITLGRVLNPPQRRLIAAVEQDITDGRPVRYITLKARQVGISTITEAMAFQWAFCLNRSRGLIVSHTGESTKHLIDMTHHYWQTWWARELYRTTSNARDRLAWEPTHSSISLLPAKSQEGARSRTLHFVHASEAAFWDHPKELMYALQAGVPRTALSAIFVESTANGIGNWFHETWEASKRGDVEFRPMFFPWWAHPEYTAHHVGRGEDARKLLLARPVAGGTLDDEEWHLYRGLTQRGIPDVEIRSRLIWRRLTIATEMSGDLDKFHQEYPATDDEAFLSTGRNVFQLEYLRAVYDPIIPDRGRLVYDSTAANNVRFVPDPDGPLHVYYHPEPAGRYMVGIDNSKATRFGDWAVAQVLDRRTMEQMAVWRARGHKDAMFAEQMILLGYYYNEGMLAPEYNFNGATISGFLQAKYRHLYTHSKAGKMRGLHEDVVGWPMTDQTKAECMDNLTREVFAGFQGRSDFVIHDEQTYYEMKNYIVSDKGKYENSKEAEHDDTVTALAIGVSATVYERPSLMTHEMANPAEALYGTRSPVDEAFRRGVAAVAEGAGMDGVEVAPTTVEREDGTRGIRLPPPVSPYSSRKERGMYEDGEGWGW